MCFDSLIIHYSGREFFVLFSLIQLTLNSRKTEEEPEKSNHYYILVFVTLAEFVNLCHQFKDKYFVLLKKLVYKTPCSRTCMYKNYKCEFIYKLLNNIKFKKIIYIKPHFPIYVIFVRS